MLRIITHDKLPSVDKDDQKDEYPAPALQYVFKPHTSAITSIHFSSDCNYMATTSEDGSVFFFHISHSYSDKPEVVGSNEVLAPPPPFARNTVKFRPMGFISLDKPATSLTFSPDNHNNTDLIERELHESEDESSRRLAGSNSEKEGGKGNIEGIRILISTGSNNLTSLILPPFSSIDNSVSFELNKSLLQLSSWKMKIPERKIVSQAKTDAKKKELSQSNLNDGDAEKAETEAPVKKEPVLEIDDNSCFDQVLYLYGGYFLVSMTNQKGETEVRSCKFNSPEKSR